MTNRNDMSGVAGRVTSVTYAITPGGVLGRQERAESFGEIQQDRAGFENPHRRAIQQRQNLGVGIDADEAAAELIAIADFDELRIILCADMTKH